MHSLNKYTTPWPHVDVRAVGHLDVRLRLFVKRSFQVTHTLRLRPHVRFFVKRYPGTVVMIVVYSIQTEVEVIA